MDRPLRLIPTEVTPAAELAWTIEALLVVASQPLPLEELAAATEVDGAEVEQALELLAERFAEGRSGAGLLEAVAAAVALPEAALPEAPRGRDGAKPSPALVALLKVLLAAKGERHHVAPKLLASLQKLPMLRDVASDQQSASGMLSLEIDRDQAARFGIQPAAIDQALYDAFGQRQAAQFFTQANSYHVILEITPSLQADPHSLDKIYLKSPLTNQMVPLSAMTK